MYSITKIQFSSAFGELNNKANKEIIFLFYIPSLLAPFHLALAVYTGTTCSGSIRNRSFSGAKKRTRIAFPNRMVTMVLT